MVYVYTPDQQIAEAQQLLAQAKQQQAEANHILAQATALGLAR